MFSRLSAVMSGLAIVLILAFIFVVIFRHRHPAPLRSIPALPSETQEAAPTRSAPAAEPTSHAQALSLECIAERIRHAPAPFHWSYKKDAPGSGAADWEADITANSIAGTLVDSSGTYPIQADRSDSSAWNTAVSALTSSLPESAIALLKDVPAPAPAAVEILGNEYAVKYRIDSSRDAPANSISLKKALGPNGFVKGAVWVNSDGCPVKFILDVEQQSGGNSARKVRYEGDATAPIR
jgi:hypothetical protein